MNKDLNIYAGRREHAQAVDFLKFCYQSVLGPGHMAPERERAAEMIKKELADFGGRGDNPEITLLEGEAARVDVDCRISPESLAALFCLSAEGWQEKDRDKVEAMLRSAENLPVPSDEIEILISQWREIDRPAVSHSEIYKLYYRAHYRVIMKSFLPYLDAIAACEKLKRPCIIAIDGMCGSGKTTLAHVLSYVFNAPVVHMDDFFLPFEMKTPERMAEPGGNVHYERFEREVVPHIKNHEAFSYGVYSCHEGKITGIRQILPSDIIIVEGSYCLNEHISDVYDMKIFSETEPSEQMRRLEKRESPKSLEMFKERWIPMENFYFEKAGIRNACHVKVRT